MTEYSNIGLLASWVLRQDGRAVPLEPERAPARGRRAASSASANAHEGRAAAPGRGSRHPSAPDSTRAPRRAGRARAVRRAPGAARLPARRVRRGEAGRRSRPPSSIERFRIPDEQLEEHLSLLNLVNFGGGCYTVYAELHGDEVRVDKELYGDTFRRAAPADAARGAGDPARARVRRADDRGGRAHRRSTACAGSSRRRSASSSLAQTPEPHDDDGRGGAVRDADRGHPTSGASSRSST